MGLERSNSLATYRFPRLALLSGLFLCSIETLTLTLAARMRADFSGVRAPNCKMSFLGCAASCRLDLLRKMLESLNVHV